MKHSFFRFLLVGIINTIIGLSFMYLFLHLFHFSYWLSTFIGNTIGCCVSYFLNKSFTFKSNKSFGSSIIRFILVILICYVFSYYVGEKLALLLFAQLNFLPSIYGKDAAVLFGTGIYTICNYIGQKYFVFRSEPLVKEWNQ
ncbi:GtrA family protein [Bacillus sp. APMAM]|nr:GtrA family protein [Bacillus sp. APMAM]RTZ55415.1 GtrA family protein [Bacillus sp. SAJ1]